MFPAFTGHLCGAICLKPQRCGSEADRPTAMLMGLRSFEEGNSEPSKYGVHEGVGRVLPRWGTQGRQSSQGAWAGREGAMHKGPPARGQSMPMSWGRSLQRAMWLGQNVTGPSLGQEGSGDLAGPRTGFLPPQGALGLPRPAGFGGSSNNSLPVLALFQGLFQGLALCSDLDACVDLSSD